jgi:hypothetical protein
LRLIIIIPSFNSLGWKLESQKQNPNAVKLSPVWFRVFGDFAASSPAPCNCSPQAHGTGQACVLHKQSECFPLWRLLTILLILQANVYPLILRSTFCGVQQPHAIRLLLQHLLKTMAAMMSAALRDMVASVNSCQVLSSDWILNVERLQAISSEAINSQSTASARASSVAVTTLWDRDELAVRFLLEEGKLNLYLRLLSEYQEFVQRPRLDDIIRGATIVDPKEQGAAMSESAIRSSLNDFEFYMGLLLSCALRAPEAVQTIDISLLVVHVATVFKHGACFPALLAAPDISRKQLSVCFLYLRELFKYTDGHSGDRIMQLIQQHEVGNSMINVLNGAVSWPKNILVVACSCLSALMSTEQYCTHPERYISSDCEKIILRLRSSVISIIFCTYYISQPHVLL